MGKNHVKVIVYGLNRRPKDSLYAKEGNPLRIHVLYGYKFAYILFTLAENWHDNG